MIGIFDSGVGGLTVVKEIFKYLPDCQITYFGDTARLPYGTKGAGFVKKYSEKITEWLLNKNCKVIVIACNTSSAWASDYLRKKFPGVPIFEMINPAVKEILQTTKNRKVGIIGTPGTIRSKSYEKRFKNYKIKNLKIFPKACPLFVPLVEEGLLCDKITTQVIKKYLKPLKEKGIDTLIMACTHYPLLKKEILKYLGKTVNILNPAESLAKEVKEYFEENPDVYKKVKRGTEHKFFFSDKPYNLEKISKLCFNKKIHPIIKDPFNV